MLIARSLYFMVLHGFVRDSRMAATTRELGEGACSLPFVQF
jgi:hypothetical protein